MKAGLATSLSIVGVLITGGAALALNSSILDTDSATKGAPARATVVGLDTQGGVTPLGDFDAGATASGLSASGVVDVISGEASASIGTPADAPVTIPPVAPPTTSPTLTTTLAPSTEKQFKVGDAATITLVASGSKLLVKDIAITPGSGYEVTNQTSRDGDDVRITLTSPTREIEFSARLINGQIMAAVGSPSTGNLNPPRSPHHDDDDDDEHDEHDDDDEEGEHHDRENQDREHEDRERDDDDD